MSITTTTIICAAIVTAAIVPMPTTKTAAKSKAPHCGILEWYECPKGMTPVLPGLVPMNSCQRVGIHPDTACCRAYTGAIMCESSSGEGQGEICISPDEGSNQLLECEQPCTPSMICL